MDGWERTGTEDAPVWEMNFPHRPGLEVRCTVPSLRAEVIGRKVGPLLAAGLDRELVGLMSLAEVFAEDSLLGWNLTWGGRPRSFLRADRVLICEVLHAWIGLWLPTPEPEAPAEPEADAGLDAELAALSVDITDTSPVVGDDSESGLVMAGG